MESVQSTSANRARYWYLAVSILGASISPYLFFWQASQEVESQGDDQPEGDQAADDETAEVTVDQLRSAAKLKRRTPPPPAAKY